MRAAASPRLAWPVVALLWIAYLVNYLDRQVVFSIFPVLTRDLGFSSAQLGLIGTVFLWVYSLSMPIAGRISDILPRRRMVIASLILWSFATFGTGMSGSVSGLLFWRAVMGITESLFMPAALGLVAVWHSGSTRSSALALFATGQFAGIAAGGWYGGWMADHIGWRAGFYWLAALGIGYAGLLLVTLRTPPTTAVEAKSRPAAPLDVLRSRSYLALCAAFFCFCAIFWILLAWLANYIYERFHFSLTESGFRATLFLQSGCAAGVILGGILGDRAARRIPGGRFFLGGAGLFSCTPFAYALLAVDSLFLLECCSAIFGFLGGLFIANLFAGAYDVVSERNYGFAAGALNMIGGLAGGAAIYLTGVLKASVGMTGFIRWGAIASALAAAIMVAVVARYFRTDHAL
ncbi:MAG: MFS transporter [Bryobacteraceae bacterium]